MNEEQAADDRILLIQDLYVQRGHHRDMKVLAARFRDQDGGPVGLYEENMSRLSDSMLDGIIGNVEAELIELGVEL